MVLILILSLLLTLILLYLLYRNQKVCEYRCELIDRIFDMHRVPRPNYGQSADDYSDVLNANSTALQSDLADFHLVSYDDMLYRFWKPLNSFYAGKPFNID